MFHLFRCNLQIREFSLPFIISHFFPFLSSLPLELSKILSILLSWWKLLFFFHALSGFSFHFYFTFTYFFLTRPDWNHSKHISLHASYRSLLVFHHDFGDFFMRCDYRHSEYTLSIAFNSHHVTPSSENIHPYFAQNAPHETTTIPSGASRWFNLFSDKKTR